MIEALLGRPPDPGGPPGCPARAETQDRRWEALPIAQARGGEPMAPQSFYEPQPRPTHEGAVKKQKRAATVRRPAPGSVGARSSSAQSKRSSGERRPRPRALRGVRPSRDEDQITGFAGPLARYSRRAAVCTRIRS